MIGTSHGQTPYTTDQAAQHLGCCRSNTTRKLDALADRLVALASKGGMWAPSNRPDRVARSLTEFIFTAGQLAVGNRKKFEQWVRLLAEQQVIGRRS